MSVALPTYNGERFLRQSIESCLRQTFLDFELVVVDDGSTDSTVSIVRDFRDPRIVLLQHPTNLKLPTALNTGFTHAVGDYFIWMADDDCFSPNALEILASNLDQHPEIDGVYADYSWMDIEGEPTQRIRLFPQLPNHPITTHAFLYRKQIFHSLGGYKPECFLVEDYEFWLRAWKQYKLWYVETPEPLYYFRERTGSLTDRHRWKIHEMAARLRREQLGISWMEFNRQMSYVYVQAAYEAFRNKDYRQTRRRIRQALTRNPFWLFNRGFTSITVRSYVPGFRNMDSRGVK